MRHLSAEKLTNMGKIFYPHITTPLSGWQKFWLWAIALLSLLSGGNFVDRIMSISINTLIAFMVFKIWNKIFAKKTKNNYDDEGTVVGYGLLVFLAIILFAGWLGEKMHDPEDYYGGNGSYLQEVCPDCDKF